MALEDTTAQYRIEVTRTGDGAAVAAKEFANVDASARVVSESAKHASSSFHELHLSTSATRAAFHELHAVGMLVGLEMFPQLTAGALVAESGLHALRATAIATGAGLGVTGAALAGLTGIVYAAVEAWEAYHAKLEAVESGDRLREQQEMLRHRVEIQMETLKEAGKLTADQVQAFLEKMDTDLVGVIKKLQEITGTKEQLEALGKLDEMRKNLTADSLDGLAKERFEAQQNFQERRKQILDLARLAGPKFSSDSLAYLLQDNRTALQADSGRIDKKRFAEEASTEMEGLERRLRIESLQSSDSRIQQAQHEYEARVGLYRNLAAEGKLSEEQLAKDQEEAFLKLLEAQKQAAEEQERLFKRLGEEIEQSFSSGLSGALVSVVSQSKSAQQAFGEFAASFLAQTAEMIAQMEILVLLKSLLSGVAASFSGIGGGGIDPGGELKLAGGGTVFAANGLAGMVSSPTYLPKFNVLAGESGAEMLTVLARPKFMSLGGVEAIVGQAGNKSLAVTSASALAGGAAGKVQVHISMEPGLRADIVNESVTNAEVRVTQRARQNGPLREAIKNAR